jgi:hypothetical protein
MDTVEGHPDIGGENFQWIPLALCECIRCLAVPPKAGKDVCGLAAKPISRNWVWLCLLHLPPGRSPDRKATL